MRAAATAGWWNSGAAGTKIAREQDAQRRRWEYISAAGTGIVHVLLISAGVIVAIGAIGVVSVLALRWRHPATRPAPCSHPPGWRGPLSRFRRRGPRWSDLAGLTCTRTRTVSPGPIWPPSWLHLHLLGWAVSRHESTGRRLAASRRHARRGPGLRPGRDLGTCRLWRGQPDGLAAGLDICPILGECGRVGWLAGWPCRSVLLVPGRWEKMPGVGGL